MAVAPENKPYERKHVIRTSSPQHHENKLAQHSLSPEKLGVVGYVKDVAGFVKDVVEERRHRRSSASSIENNKEEEEEEEKIRQEKPRRRSSAEQHHPTAFSDAVTGLFPGVSTIGDVNASGCTHADELRSQMMHINNDQQHDSNRNLL
ncbi:hypothetical protein INT48_007774 [Thamnidium elegans]|uniref:Uncharacterized protein n=1 Tax=Thamnidium elegans TaxID=101142 RepID=A0A8H7SH66_9FUNG|nr:hypothetical protein INT48_007774 [Thamnidium elegans]